jgi:predicted ribosomally synthesized peptide with SipW-like signal peptide
MTDNYIELSRRETLAALGTVGAASAGAGLGTSAYFGDRETAGDNRLAAGELDLLVDWEEHYSDWSDDEGTRGETVWMPTDADVPADAVPVPTAADPMRYVAADHLPAFMDATATEAFPDTDANGVADDGLQDAVPTDDECGYLRQSLREAGGWVSPLDSAARTNGTVNGQTTAPGDRLVEISDVKPGDFGEVTFSLHLCGNPGYVWVTGELGANLENGLTEPEADDPDEDHAGPNAGELGDAIRTMLWYDTGSDGEYQGSVTGGEGDNVQQAGERVLLQGGLNTVLDVLSESDPGVLLDGGTTNGGSAPSVPGSGTTVGPGSAGGVTELVCDTEAGNPTCSPGLLRAVKLEENPTDPTEVELTTGDHETPAGTVTVESFDVESGTVTLSTEFPVSEVITKGGPAATVCTADGDGVELEGVTFRTPTNPGGQRAGLSHVSVCYEPGEPGDGDGGERECFPNSTTAYVGFAWWIPADVGNEIPTDSVSFDLGFYTEQCRHDDGSGTTTGDT